MSNSPHVIDINSENFEAEVVKRSTSTPVVVDFWAEWCGPCRQIGPVLEGLAEQFDGKFVLAKVDIDKYPDIAEGFGIRSIPAVFGIKDGQIIDSFVGGMPQPAIRSFIENLLPSEAEITAAKAKSLEESDPAQAEELYRHALRLAPDLSAAEIGLARLLLARGETREVHAWLKRLEQRGFLEPEAEKIKAELTVREQAETLGEVDALRERVAADPKDRQARFELAEALASHARYEEALSIALDLVEIDPKGLREPARKLMLNIFQLLPEESDLTAEYRRRLSSALF